MTNRFLDPTLRAHYAAAMLAFHMKHRDLFQNGERRRAGGYGSSFAELFWKGYDGAAMVWDRASRETLAYAYFRAGRDAAKQGRKQ